MAKTSYGRPFATTGFSNRRGQQALDALDKLRGKRHAGFEHHPAPSLRRRGRGAIEAEPGARFDKLAVTIDEIRDPKGTVAQENHHDPPLVQAQHLTLNPTAAALVVSIQAVPLVVS